MVRAYPQATKTRQFQIILRLVYIYTYTNQIALNGKLGGQNMRIDKAIWNYIENELYNYDDTKKEIQQMRNDIISQHSGGSEDGIPPSKLSNSDTTCRKAVKLLSSSALQCMNHNIRAIDKALARLNEDHKTLFELKYRQMMPWQRVCMEMPATERTYFRLRRELIIMVGMEMGVVKEI